jgi:hypothetical protein
LTGEVVDQQWKVQMLMQGISDSRIQTGKATVLANPALYADFESVENYLTTLLDEEQLMAVATRGHQRNVQ